MISWRDRLAPVAADVLLPAAMLALSSLACTNATSEPSNRSSSTGAAGASNPQTVGAGGTGPGGQGGSGPGSQSGTGGALTSAGTAGGTTGGGGQTTGGGSSGGGGNAGGSAGGTQDGGPSRDGSSTGDASDTGPVGPPAPGFPGWKYAKGITLNTASGGAAVTTDVDNYPVAVNLNAANFDFSQAKDNGEDVRFGDAGGMPIAHAVEHWDKAGKTASVWVKLVKVLGNNATQKIVMYWGNAAALDASDSQKVFPVAEGFAGVWHLDEDGNTMAGGYKDVTANQAHGTGLSLVAGSRVDARIGKGTKLVNAMNQWIRVDAPKAQLFDTANKKTVSIWGIPERWASRRPGYDTIMCKGDRAWTIQRIGTGSQFESCVYVGGHLCTMTGASGIATTGRWYHFVMVLDHPSQKLYINGALYDETTGGTWRGSDEPLAIGSQSRYPNEGRHWEGIVDEARVMSVAKDAGWVKLEYESQKEGSKFLAFGATEIRP